MSPLYTYVTETSFSIVICSFQSHSKPPGKNQNEDRYHCSLNLLPGSNVAAFTELLSIAAG